MSILFAGLLSLACGTFTEPTQPSATSDNAKQEPKRSYELVTRKVREIVPEGESGLVWITAWPVKDVPQSLRYFAMHPDGRIFTIDESALWPLGGLEDGVDTLMVVAGLEENFRLPDDHCLGASPQCEQVQEIYQSIPRARCCRGGKPTKSVEDGRPVWKTNISETSTVVPIGVLINLK